MNVNFHASEKRIHKESLEIGDIGNCIEKISDNWPKNFDTVPRVSTQNAILATIFIDRPRPDVSAESFGTVLEFLAKSEMQFLH